jgi:hypothetical protein
MEQHQKSIDDPIATKLRDTPALEKVMRQAVAEAVEKARKLGYLPSSSVQEDAVEYPPTVLFQEKERMKNEKN